MIKITLKNDDDVDLYVSVVDNQQPNTPAVFNQRLNEGMPSVPFDVQEDVNGNFLITTTATDVNDSARTKTVQQTGGAGASVSIECS